MIKVRYEGEDVVVSLFQLNKLNTLFADSIEKQLTDLFEESFGKIFFDLSKIKFIDSSGFEMLLRVINLSKEKDTEFVLCNISEEVEELVNLLKIGNKLPIVHRKFQSESLLQEVE